MFVIYDFNYNKIINYLKRFMFSLVYLYIKKKVLDNKSYGKCLD